jgi:hypothetical protein
MPESRQRDRWHRRIGDLGGFQIISLKNWIGCNTRTVLLKSNRWRLTTMKYVPHSNWHWILIWWPDHKKWVKYCSVHWVGSGPVQPVWYLPTYLPAYLPNTHPPTYPSTYSPCGPWPLFSFLNYTQSVGLLGRGIGPSRGLYLHKHRINAYRH